MTTVPHGIDHLSPAEKRAKLAALLNQRAKKPAPVAAPAPALPDQAALLDHFGTPVERLRGDVTLDAAIVPDGLPHANWEAPQSIFLTGATGFLGAFLLHELIQQTDATIRCLVRCSNTAAGQHRLRRNYQHYIGSELPEGRVVAVPGDLAQPRLGLSAKAFTQLGATIDVIYHNGALVQWINPYDQLKPANVEGTQEVFRLACTATLKPVHYVSSLSVFPIVGDSSGMVIREDDALDHGGVLHGGYTQSKWVAEMIAQLARSRGIPVCIYRPGLITGDSTSGAASTDDFICKLIKSWIELGAAPAINSNLDITPADYVSQAIVRLAQRPDALGSVYHLVNPQPILLRTFIDLIRGLGYHITSLPYAEWRSQLMDQGGRSWESAAYTLLPLFYLAASETESTLPKFDCSRTLDALLPEMACPPTDARLVAAYFDYFAKTGFIPPAPGPLQREVAAP